MLPISELKGFNCERILVKYSYGYTTTGYYKDGLILLDGNKTQNVWANPDEFKSFMKLSEINHISELLKNKESLKEKLAEYHLQEKIHSMNENQIIEYFDTTNMHAEITVFADDTEGDRMVKYGFDIKKTNGDLISGTSFPFETRKEATVKCAEKLIELSN